MIVVKVELWPGGDPARARVLDRALIANMGGDTLFLDGVRCDYRYRFDGDLPAGAVQHTREAGVWELVRKVLSDATGK